MNSGAPYMYDYVNTYNTRAKPSTMHVANTGLSNFFRRYLLQKAMSPFRFTLPDWWAENYFLYTLYVEGRVAVVRTDVYGPICQACQLGGYNVFYQPSFITIGNPLIRYTSNPVIGRDCELIRLQPDYGGIYDIVSYYGDLMALCAQAGGVNIFNSHLSYILSARNKSQAESLKHLVDRVLSGEAAVVVDSALANNDGSLPIQMFSQDLRSNFIAPELFEMLQNLERMFDQAVGLPNANTLKKERMVVDEVAANNFSTISKLGIWYDQLKKDCEKVRKMFNIEIDVDWREGARNNDVDGDRPIELGPQSV